MSFYGGLKTSNGKIVLHRKYRVSLGKITVCVEVPRSKIDSIIGVKRRVLSQFIRIRDLGEVEELDFLDLPFKVYVTDYYPKVIELPVYLIENDSFMGLGLNLTIMCIGRSRYEVHFIDNKNRLVTSIGSDVAIAELKFSDSALLGSLRYSRPLEALSTNVELELLIEHSIPFNVSIMRRKLAVMDRPGSLAFQFEFQNVERPVVIVSYFKDIDPDKVVSALGFKPPVILGGAWEDLNVRLRLQMNLKSGRILRDELGISVKSEVAAR